MASFIWSDKNQGFARFLSINNRVKRYTVFPEEDTKETRDLTSDDELKKQKILELIKSFIERNNFMRQNI